MKSEGSPMSLEEIQKIKELERIGNLALRAAYEVHQKLGASRTELLHKNQFGDTALRGDVEAESAVLNVLKENNISIKVISEEHGVTVIGDDPLYLGILDGIDGSGVYRRERGTGRYGTMFAIFNTTDPTYSDYLYGGIMEHSSHKLYFASKENGAWITEGDAAKRINCSQSTQLDQKQTKLYADTNFDEVYNTNVISGLLRRLQGYNISCMRSSAMHGADLVSGQVDGVIECTRKGNLEIAVMYPLVTEAGGVMVDRNGMSLSDKKYSEFGQSPREHLAVVSACTLSVAKSIIGKIPRI